MRLEMKNLQMVCGGEDSYFEYTTTCPDCYGEGYQMQSSGQIVFMTDCQTCNGKGKVLVHRGAGSGW